MITAKEAGDMTEFFITQSSNSIMLKLEAAIKKEAERGSRSAVVYTNTANENTINVVKKNMKDLGYDILVTKTNDRNDISISFKVTW